MGVAGPPRWLVLRNRNKEMPYGGDGGIDIAELLRLLSPGSFHIWIDHQCNQQPRALPFCTDNAHRGPCVAVRHASSLIGDCHHSVVGGRETDSFRPVHHGKATSPSLHRLRRPHAEPRSAATVE